MDPLTALSLAVNVAQCVDWSRQIVCKARELYQSGTSQDVSEKTTVTQRLIDLTDRVRSLQRKTNSRGGSPNLDRICDDCITASDELLRSLQRLKVPKDDVERRRWKSLRQALKTVWSTNDINSMASRLSSLRNELTAEIIVITRWATISRRIYSNERLTPIKVTTWPSFPSTARSKPKS